MPITEEQRIERRKHVGGSDIPRLATGDAYNVWLEKVHEGREFAPSDAMAIGTATEGVVLDWAAVRLGNLKHNVNMPVAGSALAPNIDAIVTETGEPVEAKTTGLVGPVYGEWGEPGTDEVPNSVILQCHAHMIAAKASVCHVPVLIGGRGLVMYRVERCDSLCGDILDMVETFWECVQSNTPPNDEWGKVDGPTLSVLKRIVREPGKILSVEEFDSSMVMRWEQAKACVTFMTAMRDTIHARMLAALGDAEGAMLDDGQYLSVKRVKIKGGYRKGFSRTDMRIKKSPPLLEN